MPLFDGSASSAATCSMIGSPTLRHGGLASAAIFSLHVPPAQQTQAKPCCVGLCVQAIALPPYRSFDRLGIDDTEARAALREVREHLTSHTQHTYAAPRTGWHTGRCYSAAIWHFLKSNLHRRCSESAVGVCLFLSHKVLRVHSCGCTCARGKASKLARKASAAVTCVW